MKYSIVYESEIIKSNMEEVFIQSTLSHHVQAGMWYTEASKYAKEFSAKYGRSLEITSGLISVLSPQKEWFHNLELTEDFLKSNGRRVRHTSRQVSKARAIYRISDDISSEGKQTLIEKYLGGIKTKNFFHNILDPKDPNFVTIDFHMCQLMTSNLEYKDPTLRQYTTLQKSVIEFAKEHSMIPCEMQCLLWLTFKGVKWEKLGNKIRL